MEHNNHGHFKCERCGLRQTMYIVYERGKPQCVSCGNPTRSLTEIRQSEEYAAAAEQENRIAA